MISRCLLRANLVAVAVKKTSVRLSNERLKNGLHEHIVLERSLHRQTQIFSLSLGQLRQLDVDVIQMQQSDLLIQDFGQDKDPDFLLSSLTKLDVALAERLILSFEQHDLGEHLVGE